MTIYIARHGQVDVNTEYPVGHIHLSDLGRLQASQLGRRLAGMGFNGTIHVSPYLRTLQTAQAVCEALSMRFKPEPMMGEIVKDREKILQFVGLKCPEVIEQFSYCDPEAQFGWPWWPTENEDRDAVAARVRPLVNRLKTEERDVLLIGHGATTNAVFTNLTGRPLLHYNATLSAVRLGESPQVLLENDTAHLKPGQITSNAQVIG